jgi:hypothetical protein
LRTSCAMHCDDDWSHTSDPDPHSTTPHFPTPRRSLRRRYRLTTSKASTGTAIDARHLCPTFRRF